MNADAILITQPAINFDLFLSIAHQALGVSIAASSDASRRPQSDAERFLSCLASMTPDKTGALAPNLLSHVSFSVLFACDERDMLEVLECAAGIPFVISETVVRDVMLAVASGHLAAWRDAVVTGSRRNGTVRLLYNKIQGQFEATGLNIWNDFIKKHVTTNGSPMFYLEDKRR